MKKIYFITLFLGISFNSFANSILVNLAEHESHDTIFHHLDNFEWEPNACKDYTFNANDNESKFIFDESSRLIDGQVEGISVSIGDLIHTPFNYAKLSKYFNIKNGEIVKHANIACAFRLCHRSGLNGSWNEYWLEENYYKCDLLVFKN